MLKTRLVLAGLLALALLATGCGGAKKPNDLAWEIQDFAFIDQNGQEITLESLKGEVWLADFIFTNCTSVCQPMTYNMSKIQKMLKEKGIKAKIVSFTVDPERDSPEALKQFVSKFTDDQSNWHLLTGYTQEEISKFAKESFRTIAEKPTDGSDQFIHQTLFYLVDQNGIIVKAYNGTDLDFDEVVKDTKALAG
jgi:protein SCO1/2